MDNFKNYSDFVSQLFSSVAGMSFFFLVPNFPKSPVQSFHTPPIVSLPKFTPARTPASPVAKVFSTNDFPPFANFLGEKKSEGSVITGPSASAHSFSDRIAPTSFAKFFPVSSAH